MKRKSKQKQKSLWAIDLLPHSFEKTVDIPFQTCVDRLKDLEEPWQSRWGHPSYKAPAPRTYYDFYNFEIAVRSYSYKYYPRQEDGITRLQCVGTVLKDDQSGKTIVRGRFALVLRTPMFLGITLPIVLILLAVPLNFVVEIFALIISLFCVVIVLLDYLNFQLRVYEVMQNR